MELDQALKVVGDLLNQFEGLKVLRDILKKAVDAQQIVDSLTQKKTSLTADLTSLKGKYERDKKVHADDLNNMTVNRKALFDDEIKKAETRLSLLTVKCEEKKGDLAVLLNTHADAMKKFKEEEIDIQERITSLRGVIEGLKTHARKITTDLTQ